MYQDAAGTIPITSPDQTVGLVLDKSGNGHHLSQPNPTARPILRSASGRYWLEFDGVDDRLHLSVPIPLDGATVVMGCVEAPDRTATSSILGVDGAGYVAMREESVERSLALNNGGNWGTVDTPGPFPMTAQSAIALEIAGDTLSVQRVDGVVFT